MLLVPIISQSGDTVLIDLVYLTWNDPDMNLVVLSVTSGSITVASYQ